MSERHKLLLESPQLQEENIPRRTSNISSESYVLSIASLPSQYAASASSPANTIDIFDKISLKTIQTLSGHEIATTSLKSTQNLAGALKTCLVSSGKDGSVKVWDERSNSHCIKMTDLGKPRALLCCDVSPDGLTVAAGSDLQGEDALILYWDPRQPATPLRTHSSTHSDDITSLKFSAAKDPSGHNVLLSGSTDGLVTTSNADEDDDDEAVIQVGNWGCSVSQVGWIQQGTKSGSAQVWAASDMETFSTWTNDLDQLMSLDIRSPVLHHRRTWVTDYLITAHSTNTSVPDMTVFTGSNEGDIAMLSNMNFSVPDAPWCLHKLWTHGHTGVVRSLLWDEEHNVLVTGGEDTKVNAWPLVPVKMEDEDEGDAVEDYEDDSMDVDVASPRGKKRDLDRDVELKGKKAKRRF